MIATAARLLLILPLIWGIGHSAVIAVLALFVIVAMDILDGVIARATGLETSIRRITDAVVDRLLIHSASIAVVLSEPSLFVLYAPLALRDLLLALGDSWCLRFRRTHIAGRSLHRAASASFALLGFAVLTAPHSVAIAAALVAWLVNYLLLFDYLPTLRRVAAGAPSSQLTVTTTDSISRRPAPTSALAADRHT